MFQALFGTKKSELEQLEARAKYYILDYETGDSFLVSEDNAKDQSRLCKKGTFMNHGKDPYDGFIYNSEILSQPERFDFTKEFKTAYQHCKQKK